MALFIMTYFQAFFGLVYLSQANRYYTLAVIKSVNRALNGQFNIMFRRSWFPDFTIK
jgi:hypothetical protein